MSNYNGEKVLTILRKSVSLIPAFVHKGAEMTFDNLIFTDREIAEESPEFKQLIPYCLISQNSKILAYTRGKIGQEARLHAKKSIGVGGHINPCDFEAGDGIRGATLRELKEEIGISEENIAEIKFLGYVNEEESEVGKVHLGLVYRITLDDSAVLNFEDCLLNAEFVSKENLLENYSGFETWSQMIINDL